MIGIKSLSTLTGFSKYHHPIDKTLSFENEARNSQ